MKILLISNILLIVFYHVVCRSADSLYKVENMSNIKLKLNKPRYLAKRDYVDFYGALSICRQYGMILASVRSEDEEQALEDYMKTLKPGVGPGNGFWISGVKQSTTSGDYAWLTAEDPLIYHKFSYTLGNENCLEWVEEEPNKFVWKDYRCTRTLGFICQTVS